MNVSRLLVAVALLAVFAVSGCASWGKPKSSSRIIPGDSSTITYTNPESAGGPLGGR